MARNNKRRVLIIDDDERELIVLEALLEDQGYDTTTAWGGQQALKLLKEEVYDLILLDEYLPDAPSDKIMEEIHRVQTQPFVALLKTSTPSDESAFQHLPSGAHCSVNKWGSDEILRSIRECFSQVDKSAAA